MRQLRITQSITNRDSQSLDRYLNEISKIAMVTPAEEVTLTRLIREGDQAEEILNLIEADEDIALLVLGAGTSTEGPGPIVSSLIKTAGTFPIPVAVVPGHLSDEDLDAMA